MEDTSKLPENDHASKQSVAARAGEYPESRALDTETTPNVVLFPPLMLPRRHIAVDGYSYPPVCTEELVKNKSLFTPRSDDVIVTTHPRSGTTWTLEIVRQIHLAHHPNLPAEHPLKTPDHKISAPWINSWVHMTDRNLDSDPSPRLMKSHNQYCHLNLLPTDRQTKVIHVMRDPRDVLCSMYRHTQQSRTESVYAGTFQELYHYFMTGKKKGNYWDYNLQYLRNVNQHNILYLKYEDLIRDKLGGITQINSFLEYPNLTEQQIGEIDYKTTFQVMKGTQRPLDGNVLGKTGQGVVVLSEEERKGISLRTWTEFQSVIDMIPSSYCQNLDSQI